MYKLPYQDWLEMPNTTLVVSVSGGKDSQAMASYLRRTYPNAKIVAVHADLGAAEWDITHEVIRRQMEALGIPLSIVRHTKGDLVWGIRRRMKTRPSVPPWPSSAARYCTSDWKRSVISRWIRQTFPANHRVICAMGLRADESRARAKRDDWAVREDCWSIEKQRDVYDWLPIHDWTEEDVWDEIGLTMSELDRWRYSTQFDLRADVIGRELIVDILMDSFPAHPAYALGNQRLSCALCVLASLNDLMNGIDQSPKLYRMYCWIEMRSGFSFRKGLWLGSLRPDLLTPRLKAWYISKGVL